MPHPSAVLASNTRYGFWGNGRAGQCHQIAVCVTLDILRLGVILQIQQAFVIGNLLQLVHAGIGAGRCLLIGTQQFFASDFHRRIQILLLGDYLAVCANVTNDTTQLLGRLCKHLVGFALDNIVKYNLGGCY